MSNGTLMPWYKDEKSPGGDPFRSLHRQMDELLENFFGRPAQRGAFWPTIDVTETDAELQVKADLPGMEEKDVEALLSDDTLVLKGEKRREKEEKGQESHRIERSYGSFRREVALPCKVQTENVKATFANGVLSITLPKSAEASKHKKISLQTK